MRALRDAIGPASGRTLAALVICLLAVGCGGKPLAAPGQPVRPSGGGPPPRSVPAPRPDADRQAPDGQAPTLWSAKADPAPPSEAKSPNLDAYPIALVQGASVSFPHAARPTALISQGAGKDLEVVRIDLATGERSNSLRLGEALPPLVTTSPGGKLLAGRLLQGDSHVRLWSFETGRIAGDRVLPEALAPRAAGVSILRFASDDRLIAIRPAGPGGEAIVVPAGASNEPMRQMLLPNLLDGGVGVSPGGRYLAVLGKGRLFAFDLDVGPCCGIGSFDAKHLGDAYNCGDLAFSPDGREVATLIRMHDGDVRLLVWDFTTGELTRSTAWAADAWRRRCPNFSPQFDEQPLAWLPDGSGWVLYGRFVWNRDEKLPSQDFPEPEDESVRRLVDAGHVVTFSTDADGNKSLRLLAREGAAAAPGELAAAPGPPREGEPSGDEAWEATADPAAQRPVIGDKSLAAFGRPLGEPRFSQRPGAFAALPVGDRYAILDLAAGVETRRIEASASPAPRVFDVSPYGRLLAVGGSSQSEDSLTVRILDATTGEEAWTIDASAGGDALVEFLSPSKLLVTEPIPDSSARRCTVYDLAAKKVALSFETPQEFGSYVRGSHAVSPGGRWLTFASDGHLRVVDLTTGQVGGSAKIPLPPRIANVDEIRSPAFSLDGSRLLWLVDHVESGFSAVVWDMATGKVVSDVAIDEAALAAAAGSQEDVFVSDSVPWRLDGADWLVYGQAAIDVSTGEVAGPFAFDRTNALLPLDARRFLVAEVAIGTDDEAIVVHPVTSGETRSGEVAVTMLADLRPKPGVPAPVAPPRAAAPPADVVAKMEEGDVPAEDAGPAWEPVVDPPAAGAAFVAADEFEGPASSVNGFVVSEPVPAFVLEVDESDDIAKLRDVRTGLYVGETFEFAGDARLAAVRFDGAFVAQAGDDADVIVQNVADGTSVVYENDESFHYLRWLGFDGEGDVVAAFSDDDDLIHVRMLRPDRQEVVREFGIARDEWDVRNAGFAISPGGKWLAAVRIDGLTLYDLADPSIRREAAMPYPNDASQHPILVCEAAKFSPDGRYLAAVCRRLQTAFLVMWDLETGEPTTYRPYTRSFAERAPRIEENGPAFAWTPDGKALVWMSSVLIDPTTGTPYWVMPGDELVPIVALSPDKMLAVGEDGDGGHKLVAAPLPIGPIEKTRQEAFAAPSEAALPLVPIAAATYRVPAQEPAAAAPAFAPDPPADALTLATSIEVGPHENGGRIPAFRLAASGVAIVERQVILDVPSVGGPMTPERQSKLEAYSLADGELLGSVEIPGRSRLLAVSPDGELALCGMPAGDFNFDEFGRLDVWWPKQKKHVLSWRPVPIESPIDEAVRWAAFVDRRRVLTFASETLTCWELPTCRVIYRMPFGFHPPRIGAGGKRLIHPKDRVVRDALTGAVVAKLEGFDEGGKFTTLNDATPDGDGASVLGVAGDRDQNYVVRWDLPSGKILEEHPIPRDIGSVSRIGDDRLRLQSMTFGDFLFSRSLGSPTAKLNIDEYRAEIGPDGSFWRVENARAVRLRRIVDSDLPLPAKAPDILAVPRGVAVGVDVDSNLPNAGAVRAALIAELEKSGYRIDAGAGVRAKLTMNRVDKTLRKGPPRDVVIPYVQGRIQIVAADGQVVWDQTLERMWERPEDVDPAGWIEQHEIPSLFYRPDWGARLETVTVPSFE